MGSWDPLCRVIESVVSTQSVSQGLFYPPPLASLSHSERRSSCRVLPRLFQGEITSSLRFQLGMQTQHGILSCTSSDRLSSGASQVPAFHQTPSQAHNETMQANGFSLPSRLDVRGFLLTLWDLPRDSTQTASHQRCRYWDAYWGLDQVTWRVCSWNTDAPSMTPHEVLFPRGARSPLFSGKIPKRG